MIVVAAVLGVALYQQPTFENRRVNHLVSLLDSSSDADVIAQNEISHYLRGMAFQKPLHPEKLVNYLVRAGLEERVGSRLLLNLYVSYLITLFDLPPTPRVAEKGGFIYVTDKGDGWPCAKRGAAGPYLHYSKVLTMPFGIWGNVIADWSKIEHLDKELWQSDRFRDQW